WRSGTGPETIESGDGDTRLSDTPMASGDNLNADPSAQPAGAAHDPFALSPAAAQHEGRNFLAIALYQIVIRVGWIFKTESIVMPAVLDTITGGGALAGLLRGLLPVLNRLGQSVPPMLIARRIKVMPRKRLSVLRSTLVMAAVLLALAFMWWTQQGRSPWWMWLAFLVGYATFFIATGINNLSLGTLQGKLIHATRRGRLMTTSNTLGAVAAIFAAGTLMPLWLSADSGKFHLVFGFTGLTFIVGAVCILLTVEPPDDYVEPSRGVRHIFQSAWEIVARDRNFRRLTLVGMAFGASLVLFPHYQALARSERLGMDLTDLVLWVVLQNAGTGVFGLLTGPLADRRGNRLVMQLVLLCIAAMPLAAIAFSHMPAWGPWLYPGIFFFLGITPVGFKTLNNYTLEISTADQHPRCLSTLALGMAGPLLLSPAFGFLVDWIGFDVVFVAISGVVLAGWALSLSLEEPRDGRAAQET
ncbi:MAG: MFS transporter, partial [Planctomycetales bacterium]|nr:MFS transporter [Planctomycetales bacterium]